MTIGAVITVNDTMQTDNEYKLVAPVGRKFAEGLEPFYTPAQVSLPPFTGEVPRRGDGGSLAPTKTPSVCCADTSPICMGEE